MNTGEPLGVKVISVSSSRKRSSSVDASHDGVDGGDGGDGVGDHAAFAGGRDGLQVGEGGVAVVHPVGSGAAVGDHVHAEFAAGRFDGEVDLSGRHADAFGDQFEVVDQPFHGVAHDLGDVFGGVAQPVGAQFQVGGPGQLLVGQHHRARCGLQSVDALADDLQ